MGIKANNAIWHGNTRFNRNTEIKDSKSINRIHEKHNRERRKNRIKKIKMGLRTKERGNKIQKNKEIRREWKIPTFQSQLRRQEWLMYMKGKKTQSIAYNTSKKIAEEKIKEMKTELKN